MTDHKYGVGYNSTTLPSILGQLDQREKEILYSRYRLSRMYRKIDTLSIECMKIYAFCDLTPEQKEQVDQRSERYRAFKNNIRNKLTEIARKNANDPFTILRFDEPGAIVNDPEAIVANAILLKRNIEKHPEYTSYSRF